MFTEERLDVAWLADELYDPAKQGGVCLPQFLEPEACEQLLSEINNAVQSYKEAPREYINALQEFDYFHLGEADEDRITSDFEAVFRLRERFAGFYRSLGEQAGFQIAEVPNSIAIQRYPKDSLGITPHRDESKNVNLIAIFVLTGHAPFCICADRQKSNSVVLSENPGDLILMRAPRDPNSQAEKRLRPLHYVGEVTQERISLTFREKIRAQP